MLDIKERESTYNIRYKKTKQREGTGLPLARRSGERKYFRSGKQGKVKGGIDPTLLQEVKLSRSQQLGFSSIRKCKSLFAGFGRFGCSSDDSNACTLEIFYSLRLC